MPINPQDALGAPMKTPEHDAGHELVHGGPMAACGHSNPHGYRFCGRCGVALLQRACRCGFLAREGDVFCGGCGVPLAGPGLPGVAGEKAREVEAERTPAHRDADDGVDPTADPRLDLAWLARESPDYPSRDVGAPAAGVGRDKVAQEDVRRMFASRKPRR